MACIRAHRAMQQHAAGAPTSSKRPDDHAVREKVRELAPQRRRFGFRRLGLMFERQGIKLNRKKLYRLYKEERLTVRKRGGRASGLSAPGRRWRSRKVAICAGRSTSWRTHSRA